jgi:hypothetical protein
MKFSIRGLLAVTAAIAAALGTHVAFWNKGGQENYAIWVGYYLIVVAILTMASLSKVIPLRGAFCTTALFGWAYFLSVLRAGYGLENAFPAKLGLSLIGVCFLTVVAAVTLASPIQSEKTVDRG